MSLYMIISLLILTLDLSWHQYRLSQVRKSKRLLLLVCLFAECLFPFNGLSDTKIRFSDTKTSLWLCQIQKCWWNFSGRNWINTTFSMHRLQDDTVTKKIDEQWAVQRVGDIRYLSFWTTLDSAGSYACVARNSVGTMVSQSARFHVNGKSLSNPNPH